MKILHLLFLALTGTLLAPALASAQYIYVTDDTSAGAISAINTTTGAIQTVTSPDLSSPTGIALDNYGNSTTNTDYGDLFIANSGNDSVVTYDPADNTFTPLSVEPTGLTDPEGITFDSNGNLFVTSASNGGSILEYSGGVWSTYATAIGKTATPNTPSGTGVPTGITFDASGNLYVSEAITQKNSSVAYVIAKVTKSSVTTTTTDYYPSGLTSASGLTEYGNDLWVAEPTPSSTSPSINFITLGGNPKNTFVINSHLNDPQGLAFDPGGRLYVADYGNSEVTVYNGQGGGNYDYATDYSGSGIQNPDFVVVDGVGINLGDDVDPATNAVPEPGTWVLLLSGVALLYFRQRWIASPI